MRLALAFKVILATAIGIGFANLIARRPWLSNGRYFKRVALSDGITNTF
jgi:hypothetical protein